MITLQYRFFISGGYGKVYYIYDATGQKLATYADGSFTFYTGAGWGAISVTVSGVLQSRSGGAGSSKQNQEYDQLNSGEVQPYYPPNDGAAGEWIPEVLKPGTVIDRYGREGGRFASPVGTPINQRSLPYDNKGNIYNKYEVLKPMYVERSIAAPYFGQPGGGVQYRLPAPIQDIKPNYLKPIR